MFETLINEVEQILDLIAYPSIVIFSFLVAKSLYKTLRYYHKSAKVKKVEGIIEEKKNA